MKYYVKIGLSAYGLGDKICFLNACREHIRRTGDILYVHDLPELVEAYHDENLRTGKEGKEWTVNMNTKNIPVWFIRDRCLNYLGLYWYALEIAFNTPPKFDLIRQSKGPEYAIVTPFAAYAKNPPVEFIQGVVDEFKRLTGMEVVVVGKEKTPRVLKGVNYDFIKDDVLRLMRLVQDAKFVLTPRTCVAHLAVGYGKPTYVWYPDDGVNWHLEGYPDWDHTCSLWRDGLDEAKIQLGSICGRYFP